MSATDELQTNRLDGDIDDGTDVAQKFSDFEAALRTIFGIPADTPLSEVMQISSTGNIVMTGTLTYNGDIASSLHLATKAYVQSIGSNMGNTRARAFLSSDETISGATYIPWDTADINEGSVWSISNPSRFTVPLDGDGDYLVGCSLSIYVPNEVKFWVDLFVNRSTQYRMIYEEQGETAETGFSGLAYLHDLSAGDYVELRVYPISFSDSIVYSANSTFWLFSLE